MLSNSIKLIVWMLDHYVAQINEKTYFIDTDPRRILENEWIEEKLFNWGTITCTCRISKKTGTNNLIAI